MEASDAAAMDISDEATVETVDDGYYTEKEFEDKLGDDGQTDGYGMSWNCEWLTIWHDEQWNENFTDVHRIDNDVERLKNCAVARQLQYKN